METTHFIWLAALFGSLFPLVGTVIEVTRLGALSGPGLLELQANTPLLWILDSVPLVFVLVARAISRQQPLARVERQIYPLLIASLLLPLGLLLFALVKNAQTTRTADEVNQSSALRAQSLYIYAVTQHGGPRPLWVGVLGQMRTTQTRLQREYPAEIARTAPTWHRFQSELQSSGYITWESAQAMSVAADVQTRSIERYAQRDQEMLLALVTLGLISLLLGFVKANELVRQLQWARLEQKESEERFARLAESSFEGIALSQNGIIVMVNDQLCAMFGYDASELVGMRGELLTAPELRERTLDHISHHVETAYETQGHRKDGSSFPIEVEGKTVQFRGAPARVTAVRDLTQTKRVEAQLREANQRLETLAITDELTGLFNRRFFNLQLQTEWEKAQRQQHPFSLVLLDIDRFKAINDSWGHDYGDEILKGIGSVIKHQLRAADLLARYGGEELVLLLPSTDAYGAIQLAERCRQTLETHPWPNGPITASLGIATLDFLALSDSPDQPYNPEALLLAPTPSYTTPEAMFKAADTALYAAKAAGRNRTLHAHWLEPVVDEAVGALDG